MSWKHTPGKVTSGKTLHKKPHTIHHEPKVKAPKPPKQTKG